MKAASDSVYGSGGDGGDSNSLLFRFVDLETLPADANASPSAWLNAASVPLTDCISKTDPRCPPLPEPWLTRIFADCCALLVVTGGTGELTADGSAYSLEAGTSLLLPPGTLARFRPHPSQPPQGYLLTFEALREDGFVGTIRQYRIASNPFSCRGRLPKASFRELLSQISRIAECRKLPSVERSHRDQAAFYKLVYMLMELEGEAEDGGSRQAVLRTIEVMERRYFDPPGRDELAQIAGLSPWHYSHLFKKTTGLGPNRYLAEIRIRRAKELLLTGTALRDIAHQVGYGDESHFRRTFKELVGVSPSAFARSKRDKVAAVSYHYAAHLLTLGIIPYAAPVDKERERHRSLYHDRIPVHLLRGKSLPAELWRQNMQSLADAKPELILCDEVIPPEIGRQLQQIAPTVVVPWMKEQWRGHFRTIAALLGKEKEADRWITDYDRKAADARERIRGLIGQETVALFHIMAGQLVIYGQRNGGSVLYGDLRLTPACDIQTIAVFRVVTEEQLPLYDADHALIVVDRDPASLRLWQQLRTGYVWPNMQFARRGHVRLIEETPWLEYSPYAHAMIVNDAPRLFAYDR
ncbi:helix-turn-helix domain-containing protein [Paenibacillus hodogayensis]|uniref:Helix-turn-helix domain-containing protein n=1 Tax=Paenibacillus hodogayensis TaxID=279208 RepID=A0ABV5VRU8_9BACL